MAWNIKHIAVIIMESTLLMVIFAIGEEIAMTEKMKSTVADAYDNL